MRQLRKRISLILTVAVAFCAMDNRANAELMVDFDTGLWVPFLPDYTAGSIVQGGVALQPDLFRDDQTDVGTELGLSGYYRLPESGHRIDFEFDLAGIGSMGSTATFADPGVGQSVWFASLDGFGFLASADGTNATFSFDSDVLYNRQYIGLGDTCSIGNGPIDWGIGFSHLEFEQEFTLNAQFDSGLNGQYLEDLDTNYLGGEIRGSANRRIHNRDVIVDFGVGLFNMNADYRGHSLIRDGVGTILDNDVVLDEIDEFAVTIDLAVRIDAEVAGVGVRPGLSFKYISDMPVIHHPMTEVPNSNPAFISTESGYLLGVNVEIFMLCRQPCRCCR